MVVPTEGAADTTSVDVTVPGGFRIGSFEPVPGWKRSVRATGTGEETVVSKVTWTGGKVPEGEAAYLRFEGEADDSGDYAFRSGTFSRKFNRLVRTSSSARSTRA